MNVVMNIKSMKTSQRIKSNKPIQPKKVKPKQDIQTQPVQSNQVSTIGNIINTKSGSCGCGK